jgi:hypothetical protein
MYIRLKHLYHHLVFSIIRTVFMTSHYYRGFNNSFNSTILQRPVGNSVYVYGTLTLQQCEGLRIGVGQCYPRSDQINDHEKPLPKSPHRASTLLFVSTTLYPEPLLLGPPLLQSRRNIWLSCIDYHADQGCWRPSTRAIRWQVAHAERVLNTADRDCWRPATGAATTHRKTFTRLTLTSFTCAFLLLFIFVLN